MCHGPVPRTFKYRTAATTPVAETTPTATTKRAIRALASETAVDTSPVRVVDDAAAAVESVETATGFVDDGGVDRLARAVAAAVRDGDDATVRRGRETLAALRAFRAALDGEVAARDDRGTRAREREADGGDTRGDGETRERRPTHRRASNGTRGSLSPRSRNHFTGWWQSGRQMKRGDR
jgi:hypothetical protein